MEYAKVGLVSDADARVRILPGGQRALYELRLVRYSLIMNTSTVNNAMATVAISVRDQDQIDDTVVQSQFDYARDPGIMFPLALFMEAATDVGNERWLQSKEIDPQGIRVPQLAAIYRQTSLPVGQFIVVEVLFERRRVSQEELAQAVIEAGGRART